MKRDWDIIRGILQKSEELAPNEELTLEDFENEEAFDVSYNTELLKDAGLLNVTLPECNGDEPTDFWIFRLTWQGHEFLDAIRDESIWQKTKGKFFEKGGTMTFELVKIVASEFAKKALGI